jgi:hypothetical protein
MLQRVVRSMKAVFKVVLAIVLLGPVLAAAGPAYLMSTGLNAREEPGLWKR